MEGAEKKNTAKATEKEQVGEWLGFVLELFLYRNIVNFILIRGSSCMYISQIETLFFKSTTLPIDVCVYDLLLIDVCRYVAQLYFMYIDTEP